MTFDRRNSPPTDDSTTGPRLSRTKSLPSEAPGKHRWLSGFRKKSKETEDSNGFTRMARTFSRSSESTTEESFVGKLKDKLNRGQRTASQTDSLDSQSVSSLPMRHNSLATATLHHETHHDKLPPLQTSSVSDSDSVSPNDSPVERVASHHSAAKPETPLGELKKYHKMVRKRVGFAASVFQNDPPQQIPPLKPHKGNVEITNSGELFVSQQTRPRDFTFAPYLEQQHAILARSAQNKAHDSATRLHTSLTRHGFLNLFGGEEDEGPPVHTISRKLDIDGSMIMAKDNDEPGQDDSQTEEEPDKADQSPDAIYTRCCHLREILPIKSMLKQLKDQIAPIPELHIVNVKPTMIEVLAFTDFLRVMPVVWVRMDGLELETEMIRILLASLSNSPQLSRLSFRNTKLDDVAWKYLCAFISSNKSLINLDVSCDPAHCRITPFDRKDVDWNLLTDALEVRGGIEAISLRGTHIPLKSWQDLVARGFAKGNYLDISKNGLDRNYLEKIVEWINSPNSSLTGLDIGGNDLHESYDLLRHILYNAKIRKLAVEDANLLFSADFTRLFNSEMAMQSSIRSLQMSGNAALFPDIMDTLIEMLPQFPSLARFELNRCSLDSGDVVKLCEAFVQCKSLAEIGLLDNKEINDTAAAALCVVAHTSNSVVQVNVDQSRWSEGFKASLAKYCLQNYSQAGTGQVKGDNESLEARDFSGNLVALREEILNNTAVEPPVHVLEKIAELRKNYRGKIAELLEARRHAALSEQQYESLIRLFFYDQTLERLIKQYKSLRAGPRRESLATPMTETVTKLDTSRAPLSRNASSVSVSNLKQQEKEEGVFHKLNTYLIGQNEAPPAVADLSGDALREALESTDTDKTEDIIKHLKNYTFSDLQREIEPK